MEHFFFIYRPKWEYSQNVRTKMVFLPKYNCVFGLCMFFFFLNNEKNAILFKEREKEKKKVREKEKVVGL